jgi:hypothetical protein
MSNTPARTLGSSTYTSIRTVRLPQGFLFPDTVENRKLAMTTRMVLTPEEAEPFADVLIQLSDIEARSKTATIPGGECTN